jgi:hypothetical protein
VLREIALRTMGHEECATLYVEGGVGCGILQSIADALSRSLAWPITRDDARAWLVRVSHATARKLVLAIDDLEPTDSDTQREVEDLSSATFGPGISLVVALNDAASDKLVLAQNRLSQSVIGRRALRIALGPLDDREFEIAQQVLLKHRIHFIRGASQSPELRRPWVLRAICAPVLEWAERAEPHHSIALPPLLSLDLIRQARKRFADPELRRLFIAIAKAVLDDTKDDRRGRSLILESLDVNVVRRETLKQYLDAAELKELIDRGFLKPAMHAFGVPVVFVRLPELVASELAHLLADELVPLVRVDPRHASTWIAGAASTLPVGDIVAAQAILDAVYRPGSLSFELITALLETPPERQPLSPGMRFATLVPDVGVVELVVKEDGTATAEIDGEVRTIDLGNNAGSDTYANIYEWLILSHLAALPFAIETAEGLHRVDPGILLTVGMADIVLRKPGGGQGMRATPTHELPGIGSMVCHDAGIIEPITLSIFRYLMREGIEASDWIDTAINAKSMPLLARIHIALLQVSSSADPDRAAWATETLNTKVSSAFRQFPPRHGFGN